MALNFSRTPYQYLHILEELVDPTSRFTDVQIAQRLGLKPQTVRSALRRMEEEANVVWTVRRPDGGFVWSLCGPLPEMVARAQEIGFDLLEYVFEASLSRPSVQHLLRA